MNIGNKIMVTFIFMSLIWIIGFGILALIFFNYQYLMLSLIAILVDSIVFSIFVVVGGIIYTWRK